MQVKAAGSGFIKLIAIVPALQAADPVVWDREKSLREHTPACLLGMRLKLSIIVRGDGDICG